MVYATEAEIDKTEIDKTEIDRETQTDRAQAVCLLPPATSC